ncbi:MAG: methylated-DNA-[protein]-cysteine S-methyltransferase [Solirubrobacteraceae bacterium]|jgi:methylated-DNA-[protein]-cysteine S-methyltransferase|nr:methylated-DNA-[protein]-cysteine S-methyltransferase [Solirubrobacteraceae bacterium]
MSLESALSRREDVSAAAAAAARRFAESGAADVTYAVEASPIGELFVATTRRGLLEIGFHADEVPAYLAGIAARVSPRILEAPGRLDEARRQLEDYFAGRRESFDLPLDWSLARQGFGRRVLDAATRIPFGAALSYREVAERAGNPRAVRAAGSALGANPIPIVVPCHRVLRTGGALGGYGGGLERKRWLLEHEGLILS